ncbi:ABC transporter permease [Rothia nasimurium]|uniref:ABC transporter permease n=1 Tax=Rothia nasimurium TaxID=85336 RepID=UPI001F011560|nr:ABC transporter permease [Rothia nasimurium]
MAKAKRPIGLSNQFRAFEHLVAWGQLHKVGVPGSYRDYLKRAWKYRWFVWHQSRFKVYSTNSVNRLGSAWLLLKPLLDVLFFWAVFGLLLKVDRGIENFPAFIVIGILMYQFTAGALTSGAGVMRANKGLIQGFNFPRILPVASLAMKLLLEALPMLAIMLVGIILIPPHALPSATWVLALPIFILQALMNTGIVLIVARMGWFLPDMSAILQFASRFLMYGSGVIFPVEKFVNHPVLLAVVEANPLFMALSMYRQVLLDGTVPSAGLWLGMIAWALGLLVFGFVYFVKAEERYGSVQ